MYSPAVSLPLAPLNQPLESQWRDKRKRHIDRRNNFVDGVVLGEKETETTYIALDGEI